LSLKRPTVPPTSGAQRPITERKRFLRGDTVPCTLC